MRHLGRDNSRIATFFVCSRRCKALAHEFIDAMLAAGWERAA